MMEFIRSVLRAVGRLARSTPNQEVDAGIHIPFSWTGDKQMVKDQDKAKGLKDMLLNMLQEVQDDSGVEVLINEGLPSTTDGSHVQDSEHFVGEGADIKAEDGVTRMKIVRSSLKIGFKRIGVYNLHVHLGISTDLPQDVMWGGISH